MSGCLAASPASMIGDSSTWKRCIVPSGAGSEMIIFELAASECCLSPIFGADRSLDCIAELSSVNAFIEEASISGLAPLADVDGGAETGLQTPLWACAAGAPSSSVPAANSPPMAPLTDPCIPRPSSYSPLRELLARHPGGCGARGQGSVTVRKSSVPGQHADSAHIEPHAARRLGETEQNLLAGDAAQDRSHRLAVDHRGGQRAGVAAGVAGDDRRRHLAREDLPQGAGSHVAVQMRHLSLLRSRRNALS